MGYKPVMKYWNSVFKKLDLPGKVEQLSPKELEAGLKWFSTDCTSFLDFGFGTGTILLRSLFLGAKTATGIDLSSEAVKLMEKRAKSVDLLKRITLIQGGIEKLKDLDNESFDGIILSNVLDNLNPKDGFILIDEASRLLKARGKLLLKLNPHFEVEELEKHNFVKLEQDYYYEPDGMNLWNLSTDSTLQLFKKDFYLVEWEKIYFEQFKQYNRLFKFEKKSFADEIST